MNRAKMMQARWTEMLGKCVASGDRFLKELSLDPSEGFLSEKD